jgi:hypothetical protein
MNTHLSLPISVIMASTVMFLYFACSKPETHPGSGAKCCQIQTLTGDNSIGTITYNAAGNPTRRVRSDVSTGAENYLFRYDSQNRLTDQIGVYLDGNYGDDFFEWHRFKYDNQNRIIYDSIYVLGLIGDNPLPHPVATTIIVFRSFAYDSQKRIIKELYGYDSTNLLSTVKYYYNSQQNLEKKVLINSSYTDTTYFGPYDNKVNLNKTNQVWQFLNRDYSLNNSTVATSYNKYGLPLKFYTSTKGSINFLNVAYVNLEVAYKCK